MTFYMLMFVGIALGGLLLAPMSDKYGRKPMFVGGLISILCIYLLILCAKTQRELQYDVFFYGIAFGVTFVSGFLLMLQMIPKSYWPVSILFLFIF
jgi:MFS family permease